MTRTGRRLRRIALLVGGVAVIGMAVVAASAPARLDPASNRADGALGVVVMLERHGAAVEVSGRVPTEQHDVALLLVDELHEDAARHLTRWVDAGGTLVVADPDSPFVPPSTVLPRAIVGDTCTLDALAEVRTISGPAGAVLDGSDGNGHCLGVDGVAAVTVSRRTAGLIVGVATNEPFENQNLAEADNAALLLGLTTSDPDARVVVLERRLTTPPVERTEIELPEPVEKQPREQVGDGEGDLLDLLPGYLRWVLLNLVIGWIVYAFARGRRLGRPIPEHQPVSIAGSELVRATGRLYRGTRDGLVESHLHAGMRAEIASELGLPQSARTDTIVTAAAARTGRTEAELKAALTPKQSANDTDLVAYTRRLDSILQEVRRDRHPTPT